MLIFSLKVVNIANETVSLTGQQMPRESGPKLETWSTFTPAVPFAYAWEANQSRTGNGNQGKMRESLSKTKFAKLITLVN